jgi:Mg2+ and Co2+ transporter CorA
MCQAKLIVDSLEDTLMQAQALFDSYTQMLSEIDTEISAIYHEIEVGRYNTVSGYKQLKLLQDKLRQRRAIKNELRPLHSLISALKNTKLDERLKQVKRTIQKVDQSPEVVVK